MSEPILLATNNRHKVDELRAMLVPAGYTVCCPDDLGLRVEVEETGSTFAENAILKAEAFRDASGLAALADDSGLVVEALGGEPGVRSARYGGPGLTDAGRTALLLARMASVPDGRRSARFVAALALAVPGRTAEVFEGQVEGIITREPRGRGGFGYDPVFLYPPAGTTFAELASADKDAVGHRGRALRALLRHLTSSGGDGILT